MHGRIYQILTKPLPQSEWLTARQFDCLDDSTIDYVRESPSSRTEDLQYLLEVLPTSLFKMEGDTIEVTTDGHTFMEEVFHRLLDDIGELQLYTSDPSKFSLFLYKIGCYCGNLLGTSVMFCIDGQAYPSSSTDFIMDSLLYHSGQKFYIGAILDYHY